MKDSFQREINYARLSITDYCNLYCQYCRSEEDEVLQKQLTNEQLKNIIDVLSELKFNKIRFTGGEPLMNSGIIDLIKYTNQKDNINDIGLTTNAVLLDHYLDQLIEAGLKRINISLDTLDERKYLEITKIDCLSQVKANIKLARAKKLIVKINVVLLAGVNDNEITDFLAFGRENNIQVRFIELMSIGNNGAYIQNKKEVILKLFEKVNFHKIDSNKNDVADYFVDDTGYEFGIISPMSNHFCERCNRIRFTSDGKLRLCLHSNNETDLTNTLDDYQNLLDLLTTVILDKPEHHYLNENITSKKGMSKIGG